MNMKEVTQDMEAQENKLTWGEIYREFCKWSPEHAAMVEDYRPWGTNSIMIWLNNGHAYKCKRYAPGKFTMQILSEEDIKRKYKL